MFSSVRLWRGPSHEVVPLVVTFYNKKCQPKSLTTMRARFKVGSKCAYSKSTSSDRRPCCQTVLSQLSTKPLRLDHSGKFLSGGLSNPEIRSPHKKSIYVAGVHQMVNKIQVEASGCLHQQSRSWISRPFRQRKPTRQPCTGS